MTIVTQNIQSQFLNQFTKQAARSMITYGVQYDWGKLLVLTFGTIRMGCI